MGVVIQLTPTSGPLPLLLPLSFGVKLKHRSIWACCNKPAWTEGLINNRKAFLTVLDTRKSKTKASVHFLVSLPAGGGEGSLWGSLCKALIAFMRVPPSRPKQLYLLKTPPPNTIALGDSVSTDGFEEETLSVHSITLQGAFCHAPSWAQPRDPAAHSILCRALPAAQLAGPVSGAHCWSPHPSGPLHGTQHVFVPV